MKTFSKRPDETSHERIACPVCDGWLFKKKWILDEYTFSRCTGCGLLLQNPQPRSSELVQRYDEEYFAYERENESQFFQLMLLGLRDVGFFSDVEPILESSGIKRSFLDIGCATGRLLEYMKQRGWQEKGVEVCVPAALYARDERGLDISICTLEEAGLEEASFDIIHASHLIEHLTRPDEFVRELYKVLKPGGRVFLTTPNCSGMQALLFGKAWRSAIADHMFLFSRLTLSRLLEKYGFTIEGVKTWGGIAAGMAPRPIKRILDRLVKKIGWGDVMIIRARKPV